MAKGWSFNKLLSSLGEGAFLNIGKSKGTVASGDDSRIVNSLQKGNNLNDVGNKYQSLVNIGGFPYKGRLISTDNLNDLTRKSYGFFYSVNPSSEMNYPNNVAGALLVLPVGEDDNVIQLYYELGSSSFWRRHKYSGQNWQRWTKYVSVNDNLESLTNKEQALKNIGGFPFKGSLGATDLNSLKGTKYGVYYQLANSNATSGRGYPENVAGSLLVIQNSANGVEGCTQKYITYNTSNIYYRNYYANDSKWTPWVSVLTSSGNLSEVSDKRKALINLGVWDAIYPVGIVVMFATSENPNNKFPGTTWTNANDGRIIRSTTSKNAPNTVAGSDEISITEANLPQHSHTISGTTKEAGNHRHKAGQGAPGESYEWSSTGTDNQGYSPNCWSSEEGNHSHAISGTTSTAYAGNKSNIVHYGASRFYSFWRRTS